MLRGVSGWPLLWLFTVQLALLAQGQNAQPGYSLAVDKLKSAVAYEVETKQLPCLSIALVAENQQVWAAGFGYQDAAQTVPASAQTIYRVGSVSKLFTDMAVMQLVEQERLDLDVPVQNYLPSFAPHNQFGVPLTLRLLMSHRSGLVREPPVGHYFDPDEPSLEATVGSLNLTQLVYRPNSKTKYSNAAISVVGQVLSSQLPVAYAEQIERSIFEPLGMSNSSFSSTSVAQEQMAVGWMRTYDGRRFEAPTFPLGTGPAGSLYSNVDDLAIFLVWLLKDRQQGDDPILGARAWEQMITPVLDEQGRAQKFGIGFHLQSLDGHRKIGHGGAIYGFSTQLQALPERKLGVVAACALDGSNGVVSRLADYALRLMLAAQTQQPLPEYARTHAGAGRAGKKTGRRLPGSE